MSERAERVRRSLSPFTPAPPPEVPSHIIKRNKALAELVKHPGWQYLKAEVLSELLNNYYAPPPMTPTLLVGYGTFCIIRDGTAQLIDLVETHAAQATGTED